MTVAERKYALSKVANGDYILPSNDAQTIWRIARYPDGPSSGIMDWPRDQMFWGIWRWDGNVNVETYLDVEDWNRWEMVEGSFETRAVAVEAAINAR